MIRRVIVVLALSLAASPLLSASAGGAEAVQYGLSVSVGLANGPVQDTTFTDIPVHFSGQLTVEFHGDPATGCAGRGLCGFSGTVIWQPPSTGTLSADSFREHGSTHYDVSLQPSGSPGPASFPINGGVTTANVRFAPPGANAAGSVCADAATTGADIPMPVHLRAASLTLAAATPELLATRCAAPLQSDISHLLARRVVDLATLSHGETEVSLASSGSFASNGFAGTVSSTVRLALGRPDTTRPANSSPPPGAPRSRIADVRYRARLSGSVLVDARADPATCAPVGSCGATGTFALQLHPRTGTLELFAFASPRRPARDLLAALGLGKGNPRGINGFAAFVGGAATTDAVTMAQGANTCKDFGGAGRAAVVLGIGGGRVSAEYVMAQPSLHLRCPGPALEPTTRLALGTARLGALGHRGGTIHLKTGIRFNDDGYSGRTVADLALTISDPRAKVVTNALRGTGRG